MVKTLAEAYAGDFLIGAAVTAAVLDSHDDLMRQFSCLTPENAMKPARLHPTENEYNFREADMIATYAGACKMKLRGHTLVWHNQTPDWFFLDGDQPASGQTVRRRMEDHIAAVAGRYRSYAYAWDVVNEAVSDKPGEPPLRQNHWLERIGPDYLAYAFRAAHKADPDALLFYNDYNETQPIKSLRIHDLIRTLKHEGVPIHGIGLQGHYDIYAPSLDEVAAAIEHYASLDVTLHITEMDISLYREGDRSSCDVPPEEWLAMQAQRYDELFALFRKYRRYISCVTMWGVADDVSWLSRLPSYQRKNWPLLFDDQHRPKEAFYRVLNRAAT